MATHLTLLSNAGSLAAQSGLRKATRAMQGTIARLSSGLRIQSAADDPAGIAVSENMRAQLRGFQQALRNGNDGIATLQVAEGGYQSISDLLVRMRELAVQGANDSLSDTERSYLDAEYQDLMAEVDRVAGSVEYNGSGLMDGTSGAGGLLTFQVGARNSGSDRISVQLPILGSAPLSVGGSAVGSLTDSQSAIDDVDAALDTLNRHRAVLGSTLTRLDSAVDHLARTAEAYGAALSGIRDTDMAAESAAFARQQVQQQVAVAMLAQANAQPSWVLRLIQ